MGNLIDHYKVINFYDHIMTEMFQVEKVGYKAVHTLLSKFCLKKQSTYRLYSVYNM